MKRANSRNGSQDGSPTDAMSKLANKYSRILARLAGPEEHRPVNLARHQTRCRVCRHPDREAIEHDYLEWRSPSEIAIDYDIPDRTSIYRHALATGLFLRRRRTFRGALERIMERAEEAEVSAASVVLAVRAYARINDDGKWVEPPHTIQFVRTVNDTEPAQLPAAATPPPPALPPVMPNPTVSEGSSPAPALPEDPQSRPNLHRNTPRSKSTLSD